MLEEALMNNGHITRLEIKNFKKFNHLVVENIGQINLITGDNNVGKTTLLEALLFSEDNLRWISHLHRLLCLRDIHIHPKDFESVNFKDIKMPEESFLDKLLYDAHKPFELEFEIDGRRELRSFEHKQLGDLNEKMFLLRKDQYSEFVNNVKHWILFKKNGNADELQWMYLDDIERRQGIYSYWPYIAFNVSYGDDLKDYVKIIERKASDLDHDEKERVVELLKIFIPDILDYNLKRIGNRILIAIATEQDRQYNALTQYGDGVQKFFRYIIEILYAKKKGETRLMIDEIDTGIHYSRMQKEWKAIFELARQTGVQLFATTHSSDCIKAFAEAADEDEEMRNNIRLIELSEATIDGEKKIFASSYNIHQIQTGIESEVNLRGGEVL